MTETRARLLQVTARKLLLLLAGMSALIAAAPISAETSFAVSLPGDASTGPVTGRLIVIAATTDIAEPRTAIGMNGPPIFGVDVSALKPGASVLVDQGAIGFPVDMKQLPPGDYNVQAVLIRYTEAKRADGHTIWVPITSRRVIAFMKEGNFYSKPMKVRIDPKATTPINLALTERIAPLPERVETPWIKHVRIKSKILSDFWGVPMTIGASVLLPRGWAEHSDARYPAVYVFGHGDTPFGFSTDPAADSPGARAAAADANVETGYAFAQQWQSDGFPRVVGITLEQPNPYFLESYSINSANNGPVGDALTKELIPYLEKTFRLIAAPHGRILEGASTGGWEALALQLHYPDLFGGAWVFNPDPIDFSRYQLVDIYKDTNMFDYRVNDWRTADRPFRRTRDGQPGISLRDLARMEAVLGSKGRSSYQLDIWQSTHGPVGTDGYPVPLFDPLTGVINREVAEYMRANGYDLTDYTRRNWATLGPKLAGKINLFAGEQDDFFLNLGVYNFQDMVRQTAGADYPIRFEYGRPKKGHNWHHKDWAGIVREIAGHVRATTPPGSPAGWEY